jgi:diguanylate cyclase (GGDEF)-like protein
VGKTIETSVRAGDVASRYGGEEFLVIAPNTPVSGAATLADRLRRKIESASVRWKGQTLAVSVSIGVAGRPTVQAATPEEIVTKADEALYFAKKSGRNRVAMHQGEGITVYAGPGAEQPSPATE